MGIAQGPGRFGAVLTAMVTPFDDDGALNVDGALALGRYLVAHGSDGLVVGGSTGESPVLSDGELTELWRVLSESLTVPVVAGTGTADTRHSIERSRLAARAGAAGLLVVSPYYNRPSQAGLIAHFTAVAGATELPVLLYDVPVRTGRRLEPATVLALARDVPNIVGVKDAAGSVSDSARIVSEAPAHFELYSGDDNITLALLAVGAVGVISVESHWAGEELSHMLATFAKGDVEGAQAVNAILIESHRFQSTDAYPNPLPAKAACRALGLPVGQCRPPMGPAPPELDEMARAVLARLGEARPAGGEMGSPVG
jgi:4-hydroxy-tetrahydrodipicolinate synthase